MPPVSSIASRIFPQTLHVICTASAWATFITPLKLSTCSGRVVSLRSMLGLPVPRRLDGRRPLSDLQLGNSQLSHVQSKTLFIGSVAFWCAALYYLGLDGRIQPTCIIRCDAAGDERAVVGFYIVLLLTHASSFPLAAPLGERWVNSAVILATSSFGLFIFGAGLMFPIFLLPLALAMTSIFNAVALLVLCIRRPLVHVGVIFLALAMTVSLPHFFCPGFNRKCSSKHCEQWILPRAMEAWCRVRSAALHIEHRPKSDHRHQVPTRIPV